MLLHPSSSGWGGEKDVSAPQHWIKKQAWLDQSVYKEGEMVHFTVLLIVNLKNVLFQEVWNVLLKLISEYLILLASVHFMY